MARMHARRKGKSSSTRPLIYENPAWVPLDKKEITDLIVKMAGEGIPSAKIGTVLRDQYGVPDVRLATGSPITQIMVDNGIVMKLPEDISNLMTKAVNLNTHMQDNKKDTHNKRSLQLIEAKIRRLERYYKSTGILPDDWKYSIKTAELELSR